VVDNAFHYLWGGGYVIESARKGYIAYTNCTASLAEVVPFGGKFPTLGTNPHSWGFPTQDALGFPICVDWATSTVAMGRVQQFAREGRALPPGAGVDAQGRETTDPHQVKALLPFGQHKGYGLALIDELIAAYIGGSLPTIRNRWTQVPAGEKGTCCFFFQAIRPDALDAGDFAMQRNQATNVKAVVEDIRGHGNDAILLPGQIEANNAALSQKYDGLLFTQAEINAFAELAKECGFAFDRGSFKSVEV
jgi:LDH2 family malate/lactate/ureidoglycolate dehydrogenase